MTSYNKTYLCDEDDDGGGGGIDHISLSLSAVRAAAAAATGVPSGVYSLNTVSLSAEPRIAAAAGKRVVINQ